MSVIVANGRKPRKRLLRRIWRIATPWVATIGFFVLWEVCCRLLQVPEFILPPPSSAISAVIEHRDGVWLNAMHTLLTTIVGFLLAVIVGAGLGVIIGGAPTLYRAFNPLLIGFNSVPKVALVPILVLWFGIGTVPAVLSAFLVAFFPITVNVATGIVTMEPELRDVLRSLGANRLDILWRVGLPRSMPYFFASLKVAITLAFVGSVISETVASNVGIGYLMMAASATFRVPLVFGALLVIAAMGVAMYAIAASLEWRYAGWATRGVRI